jgi:GH24 family phage-related lysozyme (muramidase)
MDEIKRHEGAKWVKQDEDGNWVVTSRGYKPRGGTHLATYPDTKDNPTTGFGRRIWPGEEFPEYMTPKEAHSLFEEDYASHKKAASQMPGYELGTPRQQRGLISLAYNMGPNWWKKGNDGGWVETPAAIAEGKFGVAARNLKGSQWMDDVGGNKYLADPSKASSRGPEIIDLLTPVEEEPRIARRYRGGGLIRDAYGRRLI